MLRNDPLSAAEIGVDVDGKARDPVLMSPIRTNEELWAEIDRFITALRLRHEEDLANEVERALQSNMGLTDGWHTMLDGLVAARSSGCGHLTTEEEAKLDEIVAAVRDALRR